MASMSYLQAIAAINSLQAKAEKLRKAEVAGVVARIKEAIRVYGITAADLGLELSEPAKSAKPTSVKTTGKKVSSVRPSMSRSTEPRYRDPSSGKTWNGWGKPPLWIAGKDRSAFEIAGAGAAAPVTTAGKTAKRAARKTRGAAITATAPTTTTEAATV